MMKPLTFPDAPGWSFDVDEVSANVFQVKGCDLNGRTVEMTETDPDELIEKCHQEAKKIIKQTTN